MNLKVFFCRRRASSAVLALAALAALAVVAGFFATGTQSAIASASVPPPAMDVAQGTSTLDTAVLAGGCFWGVQAVFQHVAGVKSAVSGYAGGTAETADYMSVENRKTNHAEAVRVEFDPSVISYGQLLQIYFAAAHDPTQLNRQGPDLGRHYRSTVFPRNGEQARVAAAYVTQLTKANTFGKALATTIEADRVFYPAESYHQDYVRLHPENPYVVVHELPKIEILKQFFPKYYRVSPVLVGSKSGSI